MEEKQGKKVFLGDFIIEDSRDLEMLSKYIFAVKTGDTSYRPTLKKKEPTKENNNITRRGV